MSMATARRRRRRRRRRTRRRPHRRARVAVPADVLRTGMSRSWWIWAALCVAACPNKPSKLAPVTGGGMADDPWGATPGRADQRKGDDGGGIGGLDLQGILKRVAESVSKPGPYEAPEKSKDYDPQKPRWDVLELSGSVVEKQAY